MRGRRQKESGLWFQKIQPLKGKFGKLSREIRREKAPANVAEKRKPFKN